MKIAKLFKNGQNQAIRLPRGFRFEGDEVYIKKLGGGVILIPIKNPWRPLFDSLHQFSDDFMTIRTQPKQQKRI